MKKSRCSLAIIFLCLSQPVFADLLGLANGRRADIVSASQLSVQAGANLASDFKLYGARINFKTSPGILVFADAGLVDLSSFGVSADGLAWGFGGYYQLQNLALADDIDLAFKGSYHNGVLDTKNCSASLNCDYTLGEFAFEVLISDIESSVADNIGWYASAGLHVLSTEFDFGSFGRIDDRDTELGFSAGLVGVLPIAEWYLGADYIDEFSIVGGVRYNMN